MIYTTIVCKAFDCPVWNIKVYIEGKYQLPPDRDLKKPATLMHTECPIRKQKPGNVDFDGMLCRRSYKECDCFNILPRKIKYPYV
ncbi:MAG: hypothetical protein AB1500_07645 [Bacillota bacterium]